jgi:hypothetical protein
MIRHHKNPLIKRQVRTGYALEATNKEARKSVSKIGGHPDLPINITLDKETIDCYHLLIQLNMEDIDTDFFPFFKDKMLYVFIRETEFSIDVKINCFGFSPNMKQVLLKQPKGINKALSLNSFQLPNPIYEQSNLYQEYLENQQIKEEYDRYSSQLIEEYEYCYSSKFLGDKDVGIGNPDLTWAMISEFPEELSNSSGTLSQEVYELADEFESLFTFSPDEDWDFAFENWQYPIKIGIKRRDLYQLDFSKIILGV